MRILFVTQVLPFPLDAGPKIRAHHVIRYLAAAGHEVRLLSFVRQGDGEQHLAPLRRLCSAVDTVPMVRSRLRDLRDGVRSLCSRAPFLVLRDRVPAMQRKVEQSLLSRSFDAIHADQLWMAPYAMSDSGPGLRVLDQHNAVFMVPRRMAEHQRNPVVRALLRHEARKLQEFERDSCRRFDRVVWVTDEDRRAVVRDEPAAGSRHSVIPIATDPRAQQPVGGDRRFRVTFLGGLHWPPNREGVSWFLDDVWPLVHQASPESVLTLIGKGGEGLLTDAAAGQGVEITGYVEDLQRYLEETAVFIVPLRAGAGMRVKILDAWCWGLPVVSTTIGAEGLRVRDGENLLLADDGAAFAEAVISVLGDARRASRLADGGRATVEAHYDWQKVYEAWGRVYCA
jgi:glycosyltransferase involved in cell wall biosynthesis